MMTLGEALAIAEGEHLELCDDPDHCAILQALRHFRQHCEREI